MRNSVIPWLINSVCGIIYSMLHSKCSMLYISTIAYSKLYFIIWERICYMWFGALKSDSTHHFFRNACTKSGSLRFSQFSGCWLILSVYIIMSFDFPSVRLFGVRYFCYYPYIYNWWLVYHLYDMWHDVYDARKYVKI